MELDLSLLAGFRHASVQRTAPVNAEISHQVLAATLRNLEHEGLIYRTVYAARRELSTASLGTENQCVR